MYAIDRTPSEPLLKACFALDGFDAEAAQRLMEPAWRGPAPPRAACKAPRDAAALAFFFPRAGVLHFPLTLRRADLPEHRGQVSLPGGRPQDGEALWETAVRECEEEVGLDRYVPVLLGVLAPVYIPVTHTRLYVHVAVGADPGPLRPEPREVERIEVAPLSDLLDPARRRRDERVVRGRAVVVPSFDLAGLDVWGATAMALSEMAERLRRVTS